MHDQFVDTTLHGLELGQRKRTAARSSSPPIVLAAILFVVCPFSL